MHALSGCDTVACYYGIGKTTALKQLQSGHLLNMLGTRGNPIEEVVQQATSFISACYGQKNCKTMSETRIKVWLSKTSRASSSTPKLCTLPPTTEAFKENVKRAHRQTLIWQSIQTEYPDNLDVMEYGWVEDHQNKSLLPIILPNNVELAPKSILRLVKCGCQSSFPCSSRICSCCSANMKCTIFCDCYNQGCCNSSS